MTDDAESQGLRTLIVGGGIAGLETALALADLAPGQTSRTVLAPNDEFVLRPLTVEEPFARPPAASWPLEKIVAAAGATRVDGELAAVDADAHAVTTSAGSRIEYDALVITVGARAIAHFAHAATIDDRSMDETLGGLVSDVEEGYVASIAFVSPPRMAWPLPLYELALLTATRAYDMGVELRCTIVTPEDEPLALFGHEASNAVAALLANASIETICSAYAEVPRAGEVLVTPGGTRIEAQRIVALPELVGPEIAGLPQVEHGFLSTDLHGRVVGVEDVYAAGDATDMPVKQGGLAAQQADAVAEAIAASAGAAVEPQPFRPLLRGVLFTGGEPLHMSAPISGGAGTGPHPYQAPRGSSAKVVTRYLTDALARLGDGP